MNSMIKWKLNQELTEEEGLEIIQELFGGCKKKLIYKSNQKINPNLVKIYQSFIVTKDSNFVLNFSETECEKPFVSTEILNNLSHTIKTQKYTMYIYE